jgi:hypothetical protein
MRHLLIELLPEEIVLRWVGHCVKAVPAYGKGIGRAVNLKLPLAMEQRSPSSDRERGFRIEDWCCGAGSPITCNSAMTATAVPSESTMHGKSMAAEPSQSMTSVHQEMAIAPVVEIRIAVEAPESAVINSESAIR